jgi:UDP-3-O-[3-hydroxymyristoyl] N-acetylglucosamine deacetylase / 3-hydroxyacyl-[acyl-carrier-protein] dehydratase
MEFQRTIAKSITYSGIGVHTGSKTSITFKPAEVNTGVKFIRVDLPGLPVIEANIDNVSGVERGTTISKGDIKIHTTEHILSALSGLRIDNIIIEMDANEPPVMDGSALLVLEKLKKAGVVEQKAPKNYIELTEPIEFIEEGTELIILPDTKFKISCTIEYQHPVIQTQYKSLTIDEATFEKEIAPARTYCFDYEIELLKKKGLAKGGNLDNAVVVGQDGIHNTSLRFKDEFVRHKILDLMGDLYLLGRPLKAHVIAIRCGHAANIKLAQKIKKFVLEKGTVAPVPARRKPVNLDVTDKNKILDINDIQKVLPHRYPFLFVDKIIIVEEEKKAVGIKNLTVNEDFFNGHFPGHPIMPGVLIIEAMAQTSCFLVLRKPELSNKLAYFMLIEGAKFRRPVLPGDQLKLEVELVKAKSKTGTVQGKAFVDETLVAEAEFTFSLVDR